MESEKSTDLVSEKVTDLESEKIIVLESKKIPDLVSEKLADLWSVMDSEKITDLESKKIIVLESKKITDLVLEKLADLWSVMESAKITDLESEKIIVLGSEKITDPEWEKFINQYLEENLADDSAERSAEKKKKKKIKLIKMSLGESRSDEDDRKSRVMKGLRHAPLLDSSDEELSYSDKVKYGKYEAQMVSSGGFDIDSCPQLFPCTLAPINPMKLQDGEYQKLCTFSELAIKQYNTLTGTHFGFVKYVKAVWALCSGEKYYITFEAKEHKEDPPTIFQALVYNGIPITDLTEDVQVLLVRKKSDATREDNRILLC